MKTDLVIFVYIYFKDASPPGTPHPRRKPVRGYIDGCFDIMHSGMICCLIQFNSHMQGTSMQFDKLRSLNFDVSIFPQKFLRLCVMFLLLEFIAAKKSRDTKALHFLEIL